MTADMQNRMEEEALGWVIRLAEADFADWAGFDAWLAADPAHAAAYWRLAEADRAIGNLLADAPASTAAEPVATVHHLADHRRPLWRSPVIGWAIAASLALVVGIYMVLLPARDRVAVLESKPGTSRSIALADGTRVALNGGTRIEVDGATQRSLRLDHGEARFDVAHRPDLPFTILVGDATVTDIGTSFNIVRDGSETRIEVAEGAVRYQRSAGAFVLHAGESLRVADGGTVLLGKVDPANVAAWRTRRLVYDRAPLDLVASDLARNTGLPVALAPGLAGRSFTGTISVEGRGEDVLDRFASMMDLRAERRSDGWLLTASSRDPA